MGEVSKRSHSGNEGNNVLPSLGWQAFRTPTREFSGCIANGRLVHSISFTEVGPVMLNDCFLC